MLTNFNRRGKQSSTAPKPGAGLGNGRDMNASSKFYGNVADTYGAKSRQDSKEANTRARGIYDYPGPVSQAASGAGGPSGYPASTSQAATGARNPYSYPAPMSQTVSGASRADAGVKISSSLLAGVGGDIPTLTRADSIRSAALYYTAPQKEERLGQGAPSSFAAGGENLLPAPEPGHSSRLSLREGPIPPGFEICSGEGVVAPYSTLKTTQATAIPSPKAESFDRYTNTGVELDHSKTEHYLERERHLQMLAEFSEENLDLMHKNAELSRELAVYKAFTCQLIAELNPVQQELETVKEGLKEWDTVTRYHQVKVHAPLSLRLDHAQVCEKLEQHISPEKGIDGDGSEFSYDPEEMDFHEIEDEKSKVISHLSSFQLLDKIKDVKTKMATGVNLFCHMILRKPDVKEQVEGIIQDISDQYEKIMQRKLTIDELFDYVNMVDMTLFDFKPLKLEEFRKNGGDPCSACIPFGLPETVKERFRGTVICPDTNPGAFMNFMVRDYLKWNTETSQRICKIAPVQFLN